MNKGCKVSEETRKRMRLAQSNENNPSWKGNNVGMKQLHAWVRRNLLIPEFCEMCNVKAPYDLANITGMYNRDFSNWKYLCRKCHMLSDGRLEHNKKNVKLWAKQYESLRR